MTESSDVVVLERSLFHEQNVWVYQVPPGQITSLAPRADAWDPENPFFTGSIRVLQKGDACFVQLFEPDATTESEARGPRLFAQCPIQITSDMALDAYVHDCADSSRYFMLRMEDEQSSRRAFVGIGFPDRTAAFNFKATLQDYTKYAMRQLEVQQQQVENGATIQEQTTADQVARKKSNLGLPDGATIRIKLRTKSSDNPKTVTQCSRRNDAGYNATNMAKTRLIPPPPRDSPSSVATHARPSVIAESSAIDDEDWGDFTSA
ncbi:unnamed protein product [Peronospora belbahrii]|uniref:NECAP PHear domain-containing protein n=1 Tax=Peronospora belbahrii TaxID=622444 RepID=A0AAU9KR69_9STRA|nr:unnamed protein product [Peronospora belbahrii]CAH0518366.1 unnamed protein product [Peronospora belbahrii]